MSAGLPVSKNVGIEIRNAMTNMATSIQSVATNVIMNNQQLININGKLMDNINAIKQVTGSITLLQMPLLKIAENTQALRDAFTQIIGVGGAINEAGTSSAIFKPSDVFQDANDPLLNAMILLLEFTAQMLGLLEIISENMSDVVFFLIGAEFELIKLNQKQKRLVLSSKKKKEVEGVGGLDLFVAAGAGFIGIFTVIAEKFGVFEAIMKAFEPTLEIIGALFSVFGDIIVATLIPVIQPLNDALIGLMPIFKSMGEMLGGTLAKIIGSFVGILMTLMPVVEPLLLLFVTLLDLALTPLAHVMGILEPLFRLLVPHIATFADFITDFAVGLPNAIIDVANAIIDFINKIDIFNWFPDLQRLEKIDLGTKQDAVLDQGDKQLTEQEKTNKLLAELISPDTGPITVFLSPTELRRGVGR